MLQPEIIIPQLKSFESFNLQQLEAANLLERKDFKYVFKAKDFIEILQLLKPHYNVLKIGDYYYTDYVTDYFDTKEFKFYLQHHNGELNRYKVRLRNYVQSALCYFEVKFKNNKNWTNKERQKIPNMSIDVNQFTSQIGTDPLEFKIKVMYRRVTLLSKNGEEKLTFDLNLNFSNQSVQKDFSDLCIAEVKSKTHHPYIFRQEIKKMGYRTMGLSKYCFGITQLYGQLKYNNFKQTIINVKKLIA
jgi:hypothetical protein